MARNKRENQTQSDRWVIKPQDTTEGVWKHHRKRTLRLNSQAEQWNRSQIYTKWTVEIRHLNKTWVYKSHKLNEDGKGMIIEKEIYGKRKPLGNRFIHIWSIAFAQEHQGNLWKRTDFSTYGGGINGYQYERKLNSELVSHPIHKNCFEMNLVSKNKS